MHVLDEVHWLPFMSELKHALGDFKFLSQRSNAVRQHKWFDVVDEPRVSLHVFTERLIQFLFVEGKVRDTHVQLKLLACIVFIRVLWFNNLENVALPVSSMDERHLNNSFYVVSLALDNSIDERGIIGTDHFIEYVNSVIDV